MDMPVETKLSLFHFERESERERERERERGREREGGREGRDFWTI